MAKKNYILDTSVYLTDADAIYAYGNNDIIIPLKVLEEIDKHKKRQDGVGTNARRIIRTLDELRSKGNLKKGVRIRRGNGIACVKTLDTTALPKDLEAGHPDNEIIGVAFGQQEQDSKRKTVLVSRDINMRVKCDAIGLSAEDYVENQVVKTTDELYTGFSTALVDDEMIDQYYAGEDILLEQKQKLFSNQFVMLVSNQNEKKTALAKYVSSTVPLERVGDFKRGVWGVKPRNKEQSFALDLLMNDEIPVVTLIGSAGTGKTLLAIAAGLEQVIEKNSEARYKRLIVSRPVPHR